MTYSTFLDSIREVAPKSSRIDYVRPRISLTWVPDNSDTVCYICKNEFTLWRRRHHCRACAKLVCHICSNYWIVLPRNLEPIPEKPREKEYRWWVFDKKEIHKPERVCEFCYQRLSQIQSLEGYIRIFRYFDIASLLIFAQVCRAWRRAANLCKSLFRDIQYVLPGYVLSPYQEDLLRINQEYFAGHSQWLLKLLSIVDWSNERETDQMLRLLQAKRTRSCWGLMCSRTCSSGLSGLDVLETLHLRIPHREVRDFLLSRLETLSETEFLSVLPQLVFNLRYEISGEITLLDLLLKKSLDSPLLRMNIYWNLVFLKSFSREFIPFHHLFLAKLDQKLGKEIVFSELIRGRQFVKILEDLPSHSGSEGHYLNNRISSASLPILIEGEDTVIRDVERIPLPLCPQFYIKSLNPREIHSLSSVTAPILISLQCQTSPFPSCSPDMSDTMPIPTTFPQKIIFKPECLMKDYIFMNIIRLMDSILQRELKIDFGIKTYQVLPTSLSGGLIEVIPSADTLYTIQYRKNFTIQNYIFEHNAHLSVAEIRERFIRSAAAYCVISYLLGVGDRHMENIMVSTDGYLFHIDYGYILGYDPKPMSPAMRITKDIVDAMGGSSSSDFLQFKKYCTMIYNCLRRHTSLFLSLLFLLTENGLNLDKGKYSIDRLKTEIMARFSPSENADDAEKQIQLKIDTSVHSSTPRFFIDFLHYHMKETLTTRSMKSLGLW